MTGAKPRHAAGSGANSAGACLAGVLAAPRGAGAASCDRAGLAANMLEKPRKVPTCCLGVEPDADAPHPAAPRDALGKAKFVIAIAAFVFDVRCSRVRRRAPADRHVRRDLRHLRQRRRDTGRVSRGVRRRSAKRGPAGKSCACSATSARRVWTASTTTAPRRARAAVSGTRGRLVGTGRRQPTTRGRSGRNGERRRRCARAAICAVHTLDVPMYSDRCGSQARRGAQVRCSERGDWAMASRPVR